MRLILPAILAAAVAAMPAAAAERSFPTGGNFNRVSNTTPFNVYVHTGKAPSVHAAGTDEALNQLLIENRGGELRIGSKPGRWFSWHWGRNQRARIDITVPMIAAVNLSGPGNLTVDTVRVRDFNGTLSGPGNITIGNAEAAAIELRLSGPGDLTVAGHAGRGTLSVSGPGNIHASKLALADAAVNVSGPGDVEATITRTADLRLSGPGDIRVRGGARCSIHKSGPGDISCG